MQSEESPTIARQRRLVHVNGGVQQTWRDDDAEWKGGEDAGVSIAAIYDSRLFGVACDSPTLEIGNRPLGASLLRSSSNNRSSSTQSTRLILQSDAASAAREFETTVRIGPRHYTPQLSPINYNVTVF